MAKAKYKSDLQNFTILHNEFIETEILSANEKLVFIAIKRHLNNERKTAFPSLSTIAKYSRLSKSTVQRTLKELENKGIIEVEHRRTTAKGKTSNIYTVYDYKSMWTASNSIEVKQSIRQKQEQEAIELLESIGYTIRKGKGLETDSGQTSDSSTHINNIVTDKDNIKSKESQVERYTLDQIQQIFDYDIMIHDNPYRQQDIDSVINILHTAMNTTKPTIRIAREDKPTMVVIGKLMKLDKDSIMYAIEKFSEQTERIRNPASYMLTILYSAPEQFNLDIQNLVKYNMAHWDKPE